MQEEPQASPPDEPYHFQFVEAGMRLTYEFESVGQIRTALGHTIEFFPVFSCRGWSSHKEFVASLRLIHFADQGRVVGRCLLDQDEVVAWGRFLRSMLGANECTHELKTRSLEYATRNAIRLVWQYGFKAPYLLHVSSRQPAILPDGCISQLLKIFDDFELLCEKYT